MAAVNFQKPEVVISQLRLETCCRNWACIYTVGQKNWTVFWKFV